MFFRITPAVILSQWSQEDLDDAHTALDFQAQLDAPSEVS